MTPETATPKLNEALAAFQKEIPKIAKRATANMGTFTSDYAPLEDVTAAAMPKLGEHGLALAEFPTINADGKFVLAYTLLHSSGEERSGEYPLPGNGTPQQLGSAITYARRYILCAVTGIAPGGEDDDGKAAQHQDVQMDQPRTPPRPVRSHHADTPWTGQRPNGEPRATQADLDAIKDACTALGFDHSIDGLRILHVFEQLVGHSLGKTPKNLTRDEARALRAELEGFKDEHGRPDRGKLMERLTGSAQVAAVVRAQDAAEGSQEVLT